MAKPKKRSSKSNKFLYGGSIKDQIITDISQRIESITSDLSINDFEIDKELVKIAIIESLLMDIKRLRPPKLQIETKKKLKEKKEEIHTFNLNEVEKDVLYQTKLLDKHYYFKISKDGYFEIYTLDDGV